MDNSIAFGFQENPHCVDRKVDEFIFYRTAYRHRWVGRED